MPLSPMLCGQWDGCHLWAQWSPVDDASYLFEWRWRAPGGAWSGWQAVRRRSGLRRAWLSLPTWREGAEMQARVAIAPTDAALLPEWELAQEVTFLRNRCRFLITSERRDLLLFRGTEWHCVLDGAAVSYALLEDTVVLMGQPLEVEAESLGLSGYAQLDFAGHFRVRPELGLTIENSAPSESDIAPTGRDHTTLLALPTNPLRVVFRPSVR